MDSKKRKLEEENGDLYVSSDDVRSLLDPFSKDQLIDILQEAALEHPDILDEIRNLADKDPAHRKLFVRGLSWDTSSDSVKSVFAQYGEIEECQVIMDKNSGKSKGYGFVTFKHMDAAQRALKDPSKKIEGRMTVCQLASAGPNSQTQSSNGSGSRKIYVGNVPHDISGEKLLALFSQYGEVEEGPLGFDKQTGKSRGFALFIFKSASSARKALEEPVKTIEGHQLNCKYASSEGQKQKGGSSVQHHDGGELALQQAGGIVGQAPSQNALSGLLPLSQGILSQHPALAQGLLSSLNSNAGLSSYPSLHPSIVHQLALNSSLGSSSLNPSLNSSLTALNGSLSQGGSQGLSQAYGQVPSSAGLASYGLHNLGVYGTGLGSAGASLYGMSTSSLGSQTGILQGTGGHTIAQLGQPSGARAQSLSSYFTT